ncbi:30S ribosomal protein S6 [Candidatus Parcubacteria bacterium]|nr:30S ribosomal protein S6 [Candidatus Parcubacteria bacterium]
MPDTRFRPYELTYLLSGNLEENAAFAEGAKIAKIVQDAGGIIEQEEIPKRRRFAYPIRHEHQGYFGTVEVNATAEFTAKLKDGLKHNQTLLRYLLVQQERPKKPHVVRAERRPRPAPVEAKPVAQPQNEIEQPALKDFDKKLEEILQSGE